MGEERKQNNPIAGSITPNHLAHEVKVTGTSLVWSSWKVHQTVNGIDFEEKSPSLYTSTSSCFIRYFQLGLEQARHSAKYL